VKLLNDDCKGDKQEFISRIRQLGLETRAQVEQRLPFEGQLGQLWKLSREQEKELWRAYIAFELERGQVKRAKLLYERALITLDKDRPFWVAYVQFLEKTLRDPQLVRAKFENRIAHNGGGKVEVLELMLAQALFEEEQAQIQKARKIYENLQGEIAPDCVKSLMAFINFEKRQNNTEKVKELYFRGY
jgi:hypothetical protein